VLFATTNNEFGLRTTTYNILGLRPTSLSVRRRITMTLVGPRVFVFLWLVSNHWRHGSHGFSITQKRTSRKMPSLFHGKEVQITSNTIHAPCGYSGATTKSTMLSMKIRIGIVGLPNVGKVRRTCTRVMVCLKASITHVLCSYHAQIYLYSSSLLPFISFPFI
jgi:hypothetical protein